MKRAIFLETSQRRETCRKPIPDPLVDRPTFERSAEQVLFPMNHFILR